MDEAIIGTCTEMCPREERLLREREGLLHRFETVNRKKCHQPQADISRTIKCFSRSAAGQISPSADSLRPYPVLVRSVTYLLREITSLKNEQPLYVYDFICDRLRAVRQDMTIQRLSPEDCLQLLVPMVRFHIIYGYLLTGNSRFDSKLNDTQLFECMNRVIQCYDALGKRTLERSEMESVYTLMNLRRPETAVSRNYFSSDSVSLRILISWVLKNYVSLFSLSEFLPLSAKMALFKHLPEIRRYALVALCHAFSSKNCAYPISNVAYNLSHSNLSDARNDCTTLGVEYEGEFVLFDKKKLMPGVLTANRWWVVDKELEGKEIHYLLMP